MSGIFTYKTWLNEFHVSHIYYTGSHEANGAYPNLVDEKRNEEIDYIFNYPFHYIGQGGQCFVFSSYDGAYVLKFFRFSRIQPSYLVKLLPKWLPYREKHIKKWEKKLSALFFGHQLAYSKAREESGLIFIQLHPSTVSKHVCLLDKSGRSHDVDLGKTMYVLQKKGETLDSFFSKLLEKAQVDEVHRKIRKILELYLSECKRGIYDKDFGVMHNLGFRGDLPLHLDVGKMVMAEEAKQPDFYNKLLIKIASKMRNWVAEHYPQYAEEVSQEAEKALEALLNGAESA